MKIQLSLCIIILKLKFSRAFFYSHPFPKGEGKRKLEKRNWWNPIETTKLITLLLLELHFYMILFTESH